LQQKFTHLPERHQISYDKVELVGLGLVGLLLELVLAKALCFLHFSLPFIS